jgi:hypothetical protein
MTIVENLFILGRKNSIRPSMMMMHTVRRLVKRSAASYMEANEAKEENWCQLAVDRLDLKITKLRIRKNQNISKELNL